MNNRDDRVIGIVGGMGPEAGITVFNYIIAHTKARTDQEHLSVMLMSFPKHIVDRTLFLEGKVSVNPAYSVAQVVRKLEKAGAAVVGIACNTSHAPAIFDTILEEIDKMNSNVKLLNMPLETCRYIRQKHAQVRRVGVIATNGTYKSQVYKNLLEAQGYEVLIPDFEFQNKVIHKMIYDLDFGIKSNPGFITKEVNLLMNEALLFFKRRRADAIILGCTELSFATREEFACGVPIIDAADVLALALIREATIYSIKEKDSISGLDR